MVQVVSSLKEFNELIAEDKLTVVDFYATWCGPCKAIAPFVAKLSKENPNVQFLKIDVDEVSDVAAEVGVKAMPTFMFFRKGEKVGEIVGANPNALAQTVAAKQAEWLSGEPIRPFEKPATSPMENFINTYGRFLVILIGFLIWYLKRE